MGCIGGKHAVSFPQAASLEERSTVAGLYFGEGVVRNCSNNLQPGCSQMMEST